MARSKDVLGYVTSHPPASLPTPPPPGRAVHSREDITSKQVTTADFKEGYAGDCFSSLVCQTVTTPHGGV